MSGSSFVRKGKAAAAPSLPNGTRLSAQNGSLLISSGLSDLDDIIGGGYHVGSLVLVEEDIFSDYNQIILKYFAGEGIASKHQLYVSSISSESDSAAKWIRSLPSITAPPPSPVSPSSSNSSNTAHAASKSQEDDIKIAWQYKKYLGGDKDSLGGQNAKRISWCHSFDLMKSMEASHLSEAKIDSLSMIPNINQHQSRNAYQQIYDKLNSMIQSNNELLSAGIPPTISRICLLSLGSTLWNSTFEDEAKSKSSLLQFLRGLRGLLRQSLATCVVSFPSHLYKDDIKFVLLARHAADAVFQISAFTDSSEPVSPAFADFDGIFTILKLPRLSTIMSAMPAQPSFTFQFKRKRLSIEKIHLPPDLSILQPNTSSSHDHDHDHHQNKSTATSSLLCAPGPSKPANLDF